jgi:hypothetical protein
VAASEAFSVVRSSGFGGSWRLAGRAILIPFTFLSHVVSNLLLAVWQDVDDISSVGPYPGQQMQSAQANVTMQSLCLLPGHEANSTSAARKWFIF